LSEGEHHGSRLRAAREEAGLSLRELARRCGVSVSTLSAAESGADSRCSTLAACLRELPSLPQSALLDGGGENQPLLDARACWELVAEAQGTRARRLRRTLVVKPSGDRRVTTSWHGVVATDRDLGDPSVLWRLLAGVLMASPIAPEDGWAERLLRDGEIAEERDGVLHEARLVSRRGRIELDYRCHEDWLQGDPLRLYGEGAGTPGVHVGEGCALRPALPTERVSLAVRFEDGSTPEDVRAIAWPRNLAWTPAEPDLVGRTVALPNLRRGRRLVLATFERPLPWVTLGLLWDVRDPASDPALPVAWPASPAPATSLRRARRLAGLSQRGLAKRLKASVSTVHGAERDRDLRRSTVQRYLAALDRLRPEHFVGRPREAESLGERLDTAWALSRDVFGMAVEETSALLDLRGPETWCSRTRTLNFGTLPRRERDLVLVLSNSRHLRDVEPPEWGPLLLEGEDADERDDVDDGHRRRAISRDGWIWHVVERIPASRAARGWSASPQAFGPLPEQERPGGVYSASGEVPADRAVVTIRFPPGVFPDTVRAIASPDWEPQTKTDRDVLHRVAPDRHELQVDRERSEIRLVVSRPLIGFRYGVVWGE